jgi:hypothetical protein
MDQVATEAADTNAPGAGKSGPHWSGPTWPAIFVGGLALWVATVLVTFATQNSNLIPTIILLGSFLVPVTFVTYAFSHADPIITPQRIFGAFVVGGILGVLGASLLEAELLKTPSAFTYLWVGLIEEAVKLAALWLLARRLPRYSARDGMVLGATVGLGFAAFESAGYAFNALFTSMACPLGVVETEVLRGILTPIGHGGMDSDPGRGDVYCCVASVAATGDRCLTRLVCGCCPVARTVGCLWGDSRLAHAAAYQHTDAMAHYRGGSRADRHASPGAYIHDPQLGAAGAGRASRRVDFHPSLAPGNDTD